MQAEHTGYCCNHFANLKPVENSGFASAVESQNQYTPFSGAKQTTEVAEQASCMPHSIDKSATVLDLSLFSI